MQNETWYILTGNAKDKLKELEDNSVQCCVTSPSYYGLRDYGTGKWLGGDPNCKHYRTSKYSANDCTGHKAMGDAGQAVGDAIYKSVCPLCGAVRVDEQIGLEETPEEYVERLVEVFREVKRVLKDDGTLWINIGDSYVSNISNNRNFIYDDGRGGNQSIIAEHVLSDEYKQKDLYGIPWMLAFALRKDGWYLRQDIIWAKTNPMPESVKDRCVKSHEYIFLLSKSSQYKFNYEAIREEAISKESRALEIERNRLFGDEKYLCSSGIKFGGNKYGDSDDSHFQTYSGNEYVPTGMRTKRDVWSVSVSTYKDAHFATYPEELVLPCILAGTDENDIVLDPFNGSGTTGVVALKQKRKYIGVDLNEEYVELASNRLQATALEMSKYNLW